MPGKATWFTPIAVLKNRQEAWKKIDDNGWKAAPVDLDKEITFFNNNSQHRSLPEYDLYFAYTKTLPLWDERKNRDNRRFLPDIHENIFQQEKDKPVPALSSMNYGRPCRTTYDKPEGTFRRQNATSDFKRRRGVACVKERQKPV
ncbi:unnamed protein product [Phaedon cochleariae]|uniref:Uncharacterized protein n=1 Tax=Phaedon cochleariae TaxID=80249 RepID=A0A9P0DQF2_PHACE|nr:unnamed protein product [Phaedon cochleariae]